MLQSVDPSSPTAFGENGDFVFATVTDPDFTMYMCLTDKTVAAKDRLAFCEELRRRWLGRSGTRASQFTPSSRNVDFGETEIAGMLREYNSPFARKVGAIRANLDATRMQMSQNLSMAVSRGEALDVMQVGAVGEYPGIVAGISQGSS
jgi:hypothetical protein